MAKQATISPLPFKEFFTYRELTAFVRALAFARPRLCKLGSLGDSREGRPIHLLTITDFDAGQPEDKPAYLIHGNIHAGELAGTHAALYTARQLLVDGGAAELLKRVTFYVVPRLNPDGAEFVVTTNGSVRSRTGVSVREPNALYAEDVDGDGEVLTMRMEHPAGGLVADPGDRRLLIRRRADSKEPFYRVLPEGFIHEWDGSDRIRAGGRRFDWNRNWSYDWRPEPEQGGVGDYPFSEIEMRHMAEFVHSRSNLFGVLGYHTGPAAVLRPPSTGSLSDLDEGDDKVMDELARLGSKETGFPVVPVVKYRRANSRDVNLRGHFHNFGYHHLGLFVFEFELGTLLDSAGIGFDKQFNVDTEEEREGNMRDLMTWWDGRRKKPPVYKEWTAFDHPQLGPVEIGGLRTPHLINQTLKDLAEISKGTYRFTLSHAARAPQVTLEDVVSEEVGEAVYRIRARVANRGGLPTHVTNRGRSLSRLKPVHVAFYPTNRVSLLSAEGHVDAGHLQSVTGHRQLEWFVKVEGKGKRLAEIRVEGGAGGNVRRWVER